jgi:hypothetical protein
MGWVASFIPTPVMPGLHRRSRLRHHYRPGAASTWHQRRVGQLFRENLECLAASAGRLGRTGANRHTLPHSDAVVSLYGAWHTSGARRHGHRHNLDRPAWWRSDRCAGGRPHSIRVTPPNVTKPRSHNIVRARTRCARHCADRLRGGARRSKSGDYTERRRHQSEPGIGGTRTSKYIERPFRGISRSGQPIEDFGGHRRRRTQPGRQSYRGRLLLLHAHSAYTSVPKYAPAGARRHRHCSNVASHEAQVLKGPVRLKPLVVCQRCDCHRW